jgi:hypothetical protein
VLDAVARGKVPVVSPAIRQLRLELLLKKRLTLPERSVPICRPGARNPEPRPDAGSKRVFRYLSGRRVDYFRIVRRPATIEIGC